MTGSICSREQLHQRGTHVRGGLEEPVFGRLGVGDGLLGGKRLKKGCRGQKESIRRKVCVCVYLRSNDEQRGLCVKLSQSLRHVGAIDVGDKPNVWAPG